MYASVSTGQVQPGKLEKYLQVWHDSVAPAAQQLKGFKAAYVLVDREAEKGMTIALYETKEDAQAVQTSGRFQELLAMLGDTLVRESVVRSGYEVSIQI
jgi:heme-degrading monooxygenase HmoA